MTRYGKLIAALASAIVFVAGVGFGRAVYERPHCHPTPPPPHSKLECRVTQGAEVSALICTNRSLDDFFGCVEQMETWIEVNYEGCK